MEVVLSKFDTYPIILCFRTQSRREDATCNWGSTSAGNSVRLPCDCPVGGIHVEEVHSEHHHVQIIIGDVVLLKKSPVKKIKGGGGGCFFSLYSPHTNLQAFANQVYIYTVYILHFIHHYSRFHPARKTVSCQPCPSIQHKYTFRESAPWLENPPWSPMITWKIM